jgi:RNA polymerase sigma-70 factor (ECF subfamily)
MTDPAEAISRTFRDDGAAVVARLVRQLGDAVLAEDAVQDAFGDALTAWRRDGVPANPAAWISVAARNRAIDRLRRDRSQATRASQLADLARLDAQEHVRAAQAPVVDDDRLRLIFTCCHPVLTMPARVALTLRLVGGLTTRQIARAFLVSEATMGKRIVRAKRTIRDAQIPYRVPDRTELPDRLRGVLRVLYLIFNEGHAVSEGDGLVRVNLCQEALRLARALAELLPEEAEVWGFLALLLLHDARSEARLDERARFVALDAQDRRRWDGPEISEGLDALDRASHLDEMGEYQIQAAITLCHMCAGDGSAVDWPAIAGLYDALAALNPSPVVMLNRAAAVGFAESAEAGLRLLQPLLGDDLLTRYQPLYATHADLLRRAGDRDRAAVAYEQAIALSGNLVEREELVRRRDALNP